MRKEDKIQKKYKITKFRKSVDIWTTDGDTFICLAPAELGCEDNAMKKMEFILETLNNYDRLIEVLDHCLGMMDEMGVPDHLIQSYCNAMANYGNLLTELKSQP